MNNIYAIYLPIYFKYNITICGQSAYVHIHLFVFLLLLQGNKPDNFTN